MEVLNAIRWVGQCSRSLDRSVLNIPGVIEVSSHAVDDDHHILEDREASCKVNCSLRQHLPVKHTLSCHSMTRLSVAKLLLFRLVQ